MKENKHGGRFLNITYDGKIPVVKFPKMTAPFGISPPFGATQGSYSLNTSFDNLNENSKLIPVYKKCAIITNHIPSEFDDWFTDINPESTEGYDVVVKFDFDKLVTADVSVITNLNEIVQMAGQTGDFEVSNIKVTINSTKDRSYELIKVTNE
jgi:hypothetical protein